MADVTNDYLALRREVGVAVGKRESILVTGDDAEAYLQGQLSQDMATIAPGTSAPSLLLQPQGKIASYLRVTRLDDGFVLDVDTGAVETTVTRLERFKLRTAVDFVVTDWVSLSFRGPGTVGLTTPDAPVKAEVDWSGLVGVDVIGPELSVPAGVTVVSDDAWEAVRIEAGVPAMGSELTEDTIPEAAGIVETAVSFTKGCYTGQELVARIDSRGGNVPKRLRGLVMQSNVLPPVGSELVLDDRVVGEVTSVAESLDLRAPVALCYAARSVEPPAVLEVRWAGGSAPGEVRSLPLLSG